MGISTNFKGEWGSGDLQVIFQLPLFTSSRPAASGDR